MTPDSAPTSTTTVKRRVPRCGVILGRLRCTGGTASSQTVCQIPVVRV